MTGSTSGSLARDVTRVGRAGPAACSSAGLEAAGGSREPKSRLERSLRAGLLRVGLVGAVVLAAPLTACSKSAEEAQPTPTVVASPTGVALDEVKVGDCLYSMALQDGRASVVPCGQSTLEVIAITTLPPSEFPGESAAAAALQEACASAFADYQRSAGIDESGFVRATFGPTPEEWSALQQKNPCVAGRPS